MNVDEYLPVAYRAWTGDRKHASKETIRNFPVGRILVIDTETTTGVEQTLMFGFARLARISWRANDDGTYSYRNHQIETEVIFHADDLAETEPEGYRVLADYAEANGLDLVTRSIFMEDYVRRYCLERDSAKGNPIGKAHLVFFNAPFDLSRLAYSYGEGRDLRKGSFSLTIFPPLAPCNEACKKNHEHWTEAAENLFRPRLTIKGLDSKKALISWGWSKDSGEQRGKEKEVRGHFIDLRQLVWGMTNRSTSLDYACKLFGLPASEQKTTATEYGVITPGFITYARQDVKASTELCVKVLSEYMGHPIDLQASKVFSPASIGKAYLRKMGIAPMLDRPGFPNDPSVMGHCTSTFYGARAEAHIRNTIVPVTVCDFTSMYPSVNSLMRLWDFVTADSATFDDSTSELERFAAVAEDVAANGIKRLLDRDEWPAFTGFAQVIPNGDILPVRAKYGNETWNVGISRFYSRKPVWYTYADVLASALLTGKVPQITRVMRFTPGPNKLASLKTVKFSGSVPVNPATSDFFRVMIEMRSAIKAQIKAGKSGDEGRKVSESLKVLSNSTSYGVYVEFLRDDQKTPSNVTAYGSYDEPWDCKPSAVEQAQEFCYPPIGSVITAAARLMLAIVERLVTDQGGTWLFCDTDSMAIVTSHDTSLIPCEGGQHRLPDGTEAIKPLTRDEVQGVRDTINQLNPYDRTKVPQLLKDETGDTNEAGQVYGYAVSAKRYALFTYQDGRPVVPEEIDGKDAYMKHGLGMYMNPADLSDPDGQNWIRQAWQYIVDQASGLDTAIPAWARMPAIGRITVSSPHVMRAFRQWNKGRDYDAGVKPFNFVLRVSEFRGGLTPGDKPLRQLLAPYTPDPAEWATLDWYDLANPQAAPVNIETGLVARTKVLVKSHKIVLFNHAVHPEHKSAMPDGKPCNQKYSGVLSRRTVRVSSTVHIGKESNRIDDIEDGLISDESQVFTTYGREDRTEVLAAFGDLSSRAIARLVNEESSALMEREQGCSDEPFHVTLKSSRTRYGTPVTDVDHRWIIRYRGNKNVRPDVRMAILRTAAKYVAKDIGIEEYRIGYGRDLVSPLTVISALNERE